MNGPDHYRLAEQLVEAAKSKPTPQQAAVYSAEAQVHATLAVVAATITAANWATWQHPTAQVPDGVLLSAQQWAEATS